MGKSEVAFLQGADLSEEIRAVCAATHVRCAVAFWGVGMASTLFGERDWSDIEIICNISMGATCRGALIELGAPNNKQLRCHDSLHAKVYLSDYGAIIGSANASENGIGHVNGESGKLLEAGIFCPFGSKAYDKASAWFDRLFKESCQVDDAKLRSAPERSGELRPRGEFRPPVAREILDQLPLLERLRKYPQNFPGVYIAVSNVGLDPVLKEQATEDRRAALSERNIEMKDEALFQEWPGCDLRPLGGVSILGLWIENPRAVTVDAYVKCTTWPQIDPKTVFGVTVLNDDEWEDFWKRINQKPCETRLTKGDARLIAKLLISEGNPWLFTPDEFAETLKSLSRQKISDAERRHSRLRRDLNKKRTI